MEQREEPLLDRDHKGAFGIRLLNRDHKGAFGIHFVVTIIGVVFFMHLLLLPILILDIMEGILVGCFRQKWVNVAMHLIGRMLILFGVGSVIAILQMFSVILQANALAALLQSRFAQAILVGSIVGSILDPVLLLLCYIAARRCAKLKRKTA